MREMENDNVCKALRKFFADGRYVTPNKVFFEEAALMMKLPKRHATPWKGGRLAPITIVISRG